MGIIVNHIPFPIYGDKKVQIIKEIKDIERIQLTKNISAMKIKSMLILDNGSAVSAVQFIIPYTNRCINNFSDTIFNNGFLKEFNDIWNHHLGVCRKNNHGGRLFGSTSYNKKLIYEKEDGSIENKEYLTWSSYNLYIGPSKLESGYIAMGTALSGTKNDKSRVPQISEKIDYKKYSHVNKHAVPTDPLELGFLERTSSCCYSYGCG